MPQSGPQAQVELALPGRQPLPRRGLQQFHLGIAVGRAQVIDLARAARREEYTICTAVAPEDVLTVRTYGDTRPPYGPGPSG